MPRLTPKAKEIIEANPNVVSRTLKEIILEKLNEEYSHVAINDHKNRIKESSHVIDTQILKKLIPAFAREGIKVTLETAEIARIQELAQEVL